MATTAVDPMTVEIIRNALNSAADEMNATLIRSAYTPIIYEGDDCSVALLDADHRVLGQSAGLPIFLGNLEICTRVTEERYGRDVWQPGDVWMVNDSYLGGTHLNDMTMFGPMFDEDELVGFSASRAHWLDVGAKDPAGRWTRPDLPGGAAVRPMKMVGAAASARIVDIIGLNTRFPYPTIGDLHARSPGQDGRARLPAIIERFGWRRWRRRATRSSSRPSDSNAGHRRDPGRHLRGRGRARQRRRLRRPRRDPRQHHVAGDEMTIDLSEMRRRHRRAGQLWRGAGDLGLPGRLQTARQPRPADQRRHVQAARGRGAQGSVLGAEEPATVPVVLQPARAADRPRRQGVAPVMPQRWPARATATR